MDETRYSRGRPADEDGNVEQATLQLRRGIARTQTLVADYRRQLKRLGADHPIFRWPRD